MPTDPTRGSNHLDVIFTSEEGLLINPVVTINSLLSDHNTVKMDINSKFLNEENDRDDEVELDPADINTYDLKSKDEQVWKRIRRHLDMIEWEEVLDSKSTDEAWENFTSILKSNICTFAPKKPG